jgi:hypothetical protein
MQPGGTGESMGNPQIFRKPEACSDLCVAVENALQYRRQTGKFQLFNYI